MTSYPPPPPESSNPGDKPSSGGPQYPAYPQTSGGLPAYRPAPGSPAPSTERPTSMLRAVLLMRIGAGLSLVEVIIGLFTLSTIKDNIRQQLINDGNFSQTNLDTAYNVAVGTVIVMGIISIVLWLWMAYVNGQGHKWARIVATVLGALSIIGFLTTIAQGQQTAIGVVLSAITAILAVVILVLLWSREASGYYSARSTRNFS